MLGDFDLVLLSPSFCNGSPCTTKSAHPQFKQMVTGGKIMTVGLSRFSRPGKWMFISAVNTRTSGDLQNLQPIRTHQGDSQLGPI
jgi:hypothetical protein